VSVMLGCMWIRMVHWMVHWMMLHVMLMMQSPIVYVAGSLATSGCCN
jgi:hypothetical protein